MPPQSYRTVASQLPHSCSTAAEQLLHPNLGCTRASDSAVTWELEKRARRLFASSRAVSMVNCLPRIQVDVRKLFFQQAITIEVLRYVHDSFHGNLMVWHSDRLVRVCEFVQAVPACRVVFFEWMEKPQFVLVQVWTS